VGVNKIMDFIGEDQASWWVDIQAQFMFNFKEVQRQYKENVDKHCNAQPNFKVGDQVW
jgi:hypothetical protein